MECRTQTAQIVMFADTVQLYPFTVCHKALFRVKYKITEADVIFCLISVLQSHADMVKYRMFGIPQCGLFNHGFSHKKLFFRIPGKGKGFHNHFALGKNHLGGQVGSLAAAVSCSLQSSLCVTVCFCNAGSLCAIACFCHARHLCITVRFCQTGNLCLNFQFEVVPAFFCGNVNTVGSQVHHGRFLEPYVAENTRAGIPAGVGLMMVNAHHHRIFPILQKICHIEFKGGITIFPLP